MLHIYNVHTACVVRNSSNKVVFTASSYKAHVDMVSLLLLLYTRQSVKMNYLRNIVWKCQYVDINHIDLYIRSDDVSVLAMCFC